MKKSAEKDYRVLRALCFIMLLSITVDAWGKVPKPDTPVYNLGTTGDFVTGPSKTWDPKDKVFRWTVDPGADVYTNEVYERPLNQSFGKIENGKYSTNSDYFGYLDIESASLGFDENFIYARIKMWSTYLYGADGSLDNSGLIEKYRVRIGDLLLSTTQPVDLGTDWFLEKNEIFLDTNGDRLQDGNGYDDAIANDGKGLEGKLEKKKLLYARIDPNDPTAVEFAFNYNAFSFDFISLITSPNSGIIFEATKGLTDPQNYYWNKEYTLEQAGSPYVWVDTQGLGNIYELDTLEFALNGGIVTPVPEPSALALLTLPLLGYALYRRRQKKNSKA